MTVIKGAVDNSELKSRESFLNIDTYNGVEDRLSLGYKDKDGLKYVRSFVLEKERKLDNIEDEANNIKITPSIPSGKSYSIATFSGHNCNQSKVTAADSDSVALHLPYLEDGTKNTYGVILNSDYIAFRKKVDDVVSEAEFTEGLKIGKVGKTLDGNETTEDFYVPVATDEENGVIKLGFSTEDADRNYAVELDEDGKAFVNVPWIEYENATTEEDGLMSKDDKSKLDSVEENANFYEHPEITPNTVNDETITFGETTVITGVTANENGHITSISGGLLPEIPQASEESLGLVKSSITGDTPDRDYNIQVNEDGTMKVNVPWTENSTTYESLEAVESGTDTSLVTTGEKYNWNQKAGTFHTSMADLGFSNKVVHVAEFLETIKKKYGSCCTVTFDIDRDHNSGFITDGNATTNPVSGNTLFVGDNQIDTSTGQYQSSTALLVGASGSITGQEVYLLTAFILERTGRVEMEKVTRLVRADELTRLDVTKKLNISGSNATADGVSAMINELTTGSSTPVDADYFISQYVNGGTTTTSYHRRPMSALYSYIVDKLPFNIDTSSKTITVPSDWKLKVDGALVIPGSGSDASRSISLGSL